MISRRNVLFVAYMMRRSGVYLYCSYAQLYVLNRCGRRGQVGQGEL